MTAAIYARVSTDEQSPDMQLNALRQFAVARGMTIHREYVDVGISGSVEDRPALKRLMSDAFKHKFDAVLVWKLDRFSRSLGHLLTALETLEHARVAFISYSENLDLSSPSGRFMFQVIGAMAEFERSLIRERVKCGVRNAIASGTKWGRRRVEVDLSLVPEGASLRQAAAILGVSRESVRRARLSV